MLVAETCGHSSGSKGCHIIVPYACHRRPSGDGYTRGKTAAAVDIRPDCSQSQRGLVSQADRFGVHQPSMVCKRIDHSRFACGPAITGILRTSNAGLSHLPQPIKLLSQTCTRNLGGHAARAALQPGIPRERSNAACTRFPDPHLAAQTLIGARMSSTLA